MVKLLFLITISIYFTAFAQIGIGTTSPDTNAILDVYSSNKGILFPRLTDTQMTLLEAGGLTEGMVIYNLTLKQFMGWDGSKWQNLGYEESNTVPAVSGITLNGIFENGETISALYSYSDAQNDPNDMSSFEFQSADNISGANMNIIASGISSGGSNNDTYNLTISEDGKYIRYCITPGSNTGASPGATECSTWNAINSSPIASSINITGTTEQGQTVNGNYSYNDVNGDLEGTSTFRWTRADDISGANESTIAGENNETYTLTASDLNKYIKFYVTPIALTGTNPGSEEASSYVGPITVSSSNLPFAESFETDGNGTRYTLSPATEYSDGDVDYFTRTNGTTPAISATFTGSPDGSFYFAAQDLDAEAGSINPSIITITGINISGESGLALTVALAEDDASDTFEDFDNGNSGDNNYIWFEVQIDGGSYEKILAVESSAIIGGSNGVPAIDTNFDGLGDGTTITEAWTDFTASIAGTGSTLNLRITMNLDDGDEDIAIDNIRITGL